MDELKRRRVINSLFLLWSFVGLGWAVGQKGPSFMDLRMIVNKDLDTASWLFTVTGIGYMVGSFVGGVLYDRFNKMLIIALSTILLSVFTGITPWCKWFSVMMVATFMCGFGSGWLDTGGNANMISLWDGKGRSYMQALHFCLGFGGIMSPIATEPFLAKPVCKSTLGNSIQSEPQLNDTFDNVTNVSACITTYEGTRIHFAYLISSLVVFSSSVPFLYMYIKWSELDQKATTQERSNLRRQNTLPLLQKIIVITILCSVSFTYIAVKETFYGYLATFCISYLNWSSSISSYATSVFWFTSSAGRLSGIFIVKKFLPAQLLFAFLSLLVLSFVGFLISSILYLNELIWFFIALVGFAMSITFPAVLSWTQENVIDVSGMMSSLFILAGSGGQMLNPLFLGYLMDDISPMWFVYILLGESLLCLTLFFLVYNYTMHCVTFIVPVEIRSVNHVIEITHM